MPHTRDSKGENVVPKEFRVHLFDGGHETLFDGFIRFVKNRILSVGVFWKINQTVSPKLSSVDKRRHFNDRRKWHRGVSDIRYIEIGERLFHQ